jgi:TolB protein
MVVSMDTPEEPTEPAGSSEPFEADEADEAFEPARPSRARMAIAIVVAVAVTVAFLAGAIGALFRSVGPDATPPPDPGLLAVVDAEGALATVDATGGSRIAFGAPGGAAQFPAWSPDGTRIAATRSTGGGGGSVDVFTTSEPSAVSEVYSSASRPPFYLSWSPDGGHVTFLTTEPDGIALRVAPADASSDATLVGLGAPFYWDWIDPGRLMVHVGGAGPGAYVGDVDLGGVRLGDVEGAPGLFRAPAATADGQLRAYVAAAPDGSESIVMAALGGANRHEVAVTGYVAFGFDPAGTTLAYIGPEDATAEPTALPIGSLRIVDTATGTARSALGGAVVAFFWSPDGRTIAALQLVRNGAPGVDEARLRVASAGETRPEGGSASAAAAAAPPGIDTHLVFVDVAAAPDPTIRSERDVRLGEVFAFQLIPYFDQYALSHRLWSPDSRSIALPVVDRDAKTRIVTFPADGSAPAPIADGVAAFWSP